MNASNSVFGWIVFLEGRRIIKIILLKINNINLNLTIITYKININNNNNKKI